MTFRAGSAKIMNNEYIPAISVKNLTVSYGPVPALLDVSLDIAKGTLAGVIGPNGAGKSTFLKALLGFARKDFGEILIHGLSSEKSRGLVAYVPQRSAVDWDFPSSVADAVMMGRYGHIPWYRSPSVKDFEIVESALVMVKMQDFRKRQIGELSGGQQQRVFMARALAQGGDVLLLDEPFAGVDAATERAILEVFENVRKSGRTLVVVHHDLATAAEYFDMLALIKQKLYAYGPPEKVLVQELLGDVYDGKLKIFSNMAF